MYFNKVHHPANFCFANRRDGSALKIGAEKFTAGIEDLGDSVFRLRVANARWPRQFSRVEFQTDGNSYPDSAWRLGFSPDASLKLKTPDGTTFLEAEERRGFGVSGQAWLLQLRHSPDMQFYGMGEKSLGLELSRQRTMFWNADVWADFHFHRIMHESVDPMYLSIPYLIVKRGNTYAGVLINNPFAVFMATAPDQRIVPHLDREKQPIADFYLGAPDGVPEIFFIGGPSLDELTRRMQRLCGTTPRPPLWALGHHQSRWGYRGEDDLERLDREFRKRRIPCDGLWLDIDYMRGYRVFTVNTEHLPDPRRTLAKLRKRGRHVVPIIDPGVKIDAKYEPYRDGLKHRAFCLNPAGTPFMGIVWPGATVFPDFSLPRARAWWAKRVREFSSLGFSGAWIDMNDPATGPSQMSEMLFNEGREQHATFHNQYASGMAQATLAGLEAARPGQRQFQLTRSGFIGIQKFAAVWTGDNFSNENHLRRCIPMSLNLALSGVPFNGPDVPGFGGDATPELAIAWYKACFLFPFFRNHSAIHTREQEPWAFGGNAERVIGRFIRLRYKLLPYLYNLFVEHERTGRAVLRPLFHDFNDSPELPLGHVADQFLVGPAIMQTPQLSLSDKARRIVLPQATWFDAANGRWIRGGKTITARFVAGSTPLFIRDGSLVPMQTGEPESPAKNLHDIEIHVFLSRSFSGEAELDYTADDGDSLAYRDGAETRVRVTARRSDGAIDLRAEPITKNAGRLRARFVIYSPLRKVSVNGRKASLRSHRWNFAGGELRCRISSPITLA